MLASVIISIKKKKNCLVTPSGWWSISQELAASELLITERKKNIISRNEFVNHKSNLTGLAGPSQHRWLQGKPLFRQRHPSVAPGCPHLHSLWRKLCGYEPDSYPASQTWPNLFSGCWDTNDQSRGIIWQTLVNVFCIFMHLTIWGFCCLVSLNPLETALLFILFSLLLLASLDSAESDSK